MPYSQKGQADEAIVHYERALEINPDNADAHNNLGNAFLHKGQAREAIVHYELAVKINPTNLPALDNLAWLLATNPEASLRNGARALELAHQACQISGGNHPNLLQTLAAAYAETGRFAEADESRRAGPVTGDRPGQPHAGRSHPQCAQSLSGRQTGARHSTGAGRPAACVAISAMSS